MENIITIKGYHTCKTEGGWSYIRGNAPFLSEPNNRQWLTQGYYFWTDVIILPINGGGNQ